MKKAKLKLNPLTLVIGKYNNEPLLAMEYCDKTNTSITVAMITEKNIYIEVNALLMSAILKRRILTGMRDYINANLSKD